MIPGCGCDRDEIESTRGALNCGVVLDDISVGVNQWMRNPSGLVPSVLQLGTGTRRDQH